nr:EOG090X0E58 [Triops cancriformis]
MPTSEAAVQVEENDLLDGMPWMEGRLLSTTNKSIAFPIILTFPRRVSAALSNPFLNNSSSQTANPNLTMRQCFKVMIGFCMAASLLCVIYISYTCQGSSCTLYNEQVLYLLENMAKPVNLASRPRLPSHNGKSYDEVMDANFHFDIRGHDVIVFLHIQKTGGTVFGRHLVQDLDLKRPCVCHQEYKRCDCFRPNSKEHWLFSRYSTGWKCGLHADWTELTSCVDHRLDQFEGKSKKRNYFYITVLREPVHRYLSEYRHVKRGATWKYSKHLCNGREPTPEELPRCYDGNVWEDVTMNSFLACTHNLANNRQTRMLADLTLVGCYNQSYVDPAERERIMLASAKSNLAKMAYFGLTELQQVSQYVFEETFNLHFTVPFEQYNTTFADLALEEISPSQFEQIRQANKLDLELYAYAVQLLESRFQKLKSRDKHFESHFSEMGRGYNRTGPKVDLRSRNKDKTSTTVQPTQADSD